MEGEKENNYAMPLAIVIAGIIIAGAVIYSNNASSNTKQANNTDPQKTNSVNKEIDPITKDDHLLGNPDADVILIEYSDLECPFCKTFHFTTKRIMDEYGKDGRVALVFRHYPITQLHSKAKNEAMASECAASLGGETKFWEYLDKVFETTPSNNGLDESLLPKMASDIGLNQKDFEKCLGDKDTEGRVESHMQDNAMVGKGTPHTIILLKDGRTFPIEGAQPYESVKAAIDAILTEVKQ